MKVKSEILMEQSEIIEKLAEMNKKLLLLLSQYCDVTEEEERLKKIIGMEVE